MQTSATKSLVSHRVRKRRMELSLSQEQLAQLAGVTQQRIAEIEIRTVNITLDTLDALAKSLQCSAKELVQPD